MDMIDITINLLFRHNPSLKITKAELYKLFGLATSGKHFLYDETDGFAMGSSIVAVLANRLMYFYETLWQKTF